MRPKRIGDYVLYRELHEGATAVYYLATHVDESAHRGPHVVARYHDSLVEDDLVVRELRAMIIQRSLLEHPRLATPVAYGTEDANGKREVYVAYRYVPGVEAKTLELRASEVPRRIAVVVAARIISDAARTIDVAGNRIGHDAIDLDLKSVRIGWDGDVVVTLPIVVQQYSSQFDSTPSTANLRHPSPEAVNGETLTAASNVFQLGVMLYRLVESRHPFRGSSPMETFMRIVNDRPDPLTHSTTYLDSIVARALARDPTRRFESPRALADALDNRIGSAPRTVIGAEAATLCSNERQAEAQMLEDFFDSATLTDPADGDEDDTIEELGS